MNEFLLYALGAAVLSGVLSLVGVITFFVRKTFLKHHLIYLVSFGAGALFGDAFIHLLPESVEAVGGFTLAVSVPILLGIVLSYIVEKFVHWHHCHHINHTGHKHHLDHQQRGTTLASMNLFGDAVHNFIDGVIIAASYLVSISVGIATTIA